MAEWLARIAVAARMVDDEFEREPTVTGPSATVTAWTNRSPSFLVVSVTRTVTPGAAHQAGVADLAARLGVEWRLVQHEIAGFRRREAVHFGAVA